MRPKLSQTQVMSLGMPAGTVQLNCPAPTAKLALVNGPVTLALPVDVEVAETGVGMDQELPL